MNKNDKISMEYEARVMIDENQYLAISDFYLKNSKKYHELTNNNYYYDTPECEIINNNMMLRIRNVDGNKDEVTLKVKDINGDKEITREVDGIINYSESLFNQGLLNDEMLKKLEEKNINPQRINLLTSLFTNRIEVDEDGYILVIDKNQYCDVIDYNLEVESNSRENAKKYLLEICDKFNIEYKDKYLTKSKRAIYKALGK